MNEKKNIDRLFQERFKDFESAPDDKVWYNIHAALHEKKKKRIIPMWWKLSGIAAGFILAFLGFNAISDNFNSQPAVVIAPLEMEKSDSIKLNTTTVNEVRVAVENTVSSENEAIEISNATKANHNLQNKKTATSNTLNRIIKSKNNSAVAKFSKEDKNKKMLSEKNILKEEIVSNSVENIDEKNQIGSQKNNQDHNKIATSSDIRNINNNKFQKYKDSTAIVLEIEPNPLDEILRKKNEKEELLAVTKISRWQVSTNVAPVYFNSVTNGSPIEAQFEENSKSYENNLSVGVGVQYAVNKRLSVRTGFNKVNLGYGTNDVVFFGGLNNSGISTLTSSNSTAHIEVLSANNALGLRPFEENLENTENGVLNQRMGYFEIPLEVSYAIVDNKFGIRVIGGMSTLLLNDNSVSVQSERTTMSLGKANNLNDVHFSGNAGLGFNYQFWNSFEAHFEPTLKYQFNTFSRDAGNFKPYFVGLYTGISFKF